MGKHLLSTHGHKIYCEDDRSYHGVKHLVYDLTWDETKKLLEQAEHSREVDFEDNEHRKFTLIDGENGSFTVVATQVSHGWI